MRPPVARRASSTSTRITRLRRPGPGPAVGGGVGSWLAMVLDPPSFLMLSGPEWSSALQQVLRHLLRVLSNAEQQSGLQAVQPVQPAEIQARDVADAPGLDGITAFVECGQLDPAEIARVA